jgi:hypothetical protein
MRWMSHLPGLVGDFNEQLITEMFLTVEPAAAANGVRTHYNKSLRLGAKDSASLKQFAGFNDAQYVKFSRMIFYYTGLQILAPIKSIRELRAAHVDKAYITMTRTVVDMTRVTKKNGSHITRQTKVGVMTIRPFQLIYNNAVSLLRHGMLVPSAKIFRAPNNVPPNVVDVMLYKIAADKGGGSFNMLISPVNVKCPQSIQYMQPICEFTANDNTRKHADSNILRRLTLQSRHGRFVASPMYAP